MLNAGWNWLFFKARRPRWALVEILLLEASAVDLTRRAAKVDPPGAAMLEPVCRPGRLRQPPSTRNSPSQPGRTPMRLTRTVTTAKPLDKVFAYLGRE